MSDILPLQILSFHDHSYILLAISMLGLMMTISLAVESKKRVQRRINWYSNDIGIKICEMFHTITYTKST